MKIVVFGASGKTGLHLVKMALNKGHDVTAYVRTSNKIKIKNDRLKVVVDSLFEDSQVIKVIKDQDVVISCLGGDDNKKSTILTDMIKVIVDAMKKNGVRRIAYIATAGIDNEIPGIFAKLIVSLLFKNAINDHKGAANYIRSNNLEYTIARPLSLIDSSSNQSYRTAIQGIPRGGKNISREDLARFLLESIEHKKYINESVGLSY
jgi:putative NADH-flavin reductase